MVGVDSDILTSIDNILRKVAIHGWSRIALSLCTSSSLKAFEHGFNSGTRPLKLKMRGYSSSLECNGEGPDLVDGWNQYYL